MNIRRDASVVVCGPPSSGNRLLRDTIERMDGSNGVLVSHFGSRFSELATDGLRAVFAIRAKEPQWKSYVKSHFNPRKASTMEELHMKQWHTSLLWCAEHHVPVYPISYSAMVKHPETEGQALARWLGFGWNGWREALFDSDVKWEAV